MRKLSLLAAAAFAATAVPASATITFGNQTVNQGDNVLLGSGTSGTTVTGSTQGGVSVDFISGPTSVCPGCVLQTLSEPSNGAARVEVLGGNTVLQGLTIQLTNLVNPLAGFGYIEFNIDETANLGNAVTVVINALDQFGNPFQLSTSVGNGSNFFSALATNGEVIRSIGFDAGGTTGFTDIRQVRIAAAVGTQTPVPEPATWAMMLVGFGAAGIAMRRTRRRKQLLTQIA